MASGTENLTDKTFQEIGKIAPNEYQKLQGDRGRYAEIQALVERVVNENLSIAQSLRGKLQQASSSDIQRILSGTYSRDQIQTMRHGLEVETFRMSIDRKQGVYIVSTTRNGEHIYPQRKLETLVDIDWAKLRQYASILVEAVILAATCVGVSLAISEKVIAEVSEKTVEMIRQPAMIRAFEEFVVRWNSSPSNYERARATFNLIKDSYLPGIFWKVLKLICGSMSW